MRMMRMIKLKRKSIPRICKRTWKLRQKQTRSRRKIKIALKLSSMRVRAWGRSG